MENIKVDYLNILCLNRCTHKCLDQSKAEMSILKQRKSTYSNNPQRKRKVEEKIFKIKKNGRNK